MNVELRLSQPSVGEVESLIFIKVAKLPFRGNGGMHKPSHDVRIVTKDSLILIIVFLIMKGHLRKGVDVTLA